jgi:hypothetical protein
LAATEVFYEFQKNQLKETLKYDWSNFAEINKRQFEKLAVIGTAALTGDDEKTVYFRMLNKISIN